MNFFGHPGYVNKGEGKTGYRCYKGTKRTGFILEFDNKITQDYAPDKKDQGFIEVCQRHRPHDTHAAYLVELLPPYKDCKCLGNKTNYCYCCSCYSNIIVPEGKIGDVNNHSYYVSHG